MKDETFSEVNPSDLTVESMMKAVKELAAYHKPMPKPKSSTLFERLMNKCGWYRSPEIFIVKDSALTPWALRAEGDGGRK